MEIKKTEVIKNLEINTYLLSFDLRGNNCYFVNFSTLAELKMFIEEKEMLTLYNEWLDYICSDYIAEKIEGYFIGKVVSDKDDSYVVETCELQ